MAASPGRPRTISLEQIVQATVDDGLDTFSMPSVARRVGVAHSALYRYVSDREALLVHAAESILGAAAWPSTDQAWEPLLHAVARSVAAVCEEHDGFARAVLASPRMPAVWDERLRPYRQALASQGFAADDARLVTDLLVQIALVGALADIGPAEQERRSDVVLAGAAGLAG